LSTYYVSPTGNDSNPGTSDLPFATIGKSAAVAGPSDVVNILPGTYPEAPRFDKSGTAIARITFAGNGNPIVLGCLYIEGAYLTISGLTVSPPDTGPSGGDGINLDGNNNIVEGCIVTNYFATAQEQKAAIATSGFFQTVDRCSILNINDIDAFHIWGHDITVSNCLVDNLSQINYQLNHTDFVQTWGFGSGTVSYNVLFINNTVRNSSCQCGNTETDGNPNVRDWVFANNLFLNIDNSLFSGIPNTAFYNNIFDNVGANQGYAVSLYSTDPKYNSDGFKFYNNVFRNNAKDINFNSATPSQGVISNNYFAGANNAPKINNENQGVNFINGGDPKFVNPPLNYRLASDSFLIGAGIPTPITVDRDGAAIAGSWPIGPYLYVPPIPPGPPVIIPPPDGTPPPPTPIAPGETFPPIVLAPVPANPNDSIFSSDLTSPTPEVVFENPSFKAMTAAFTNALQTFLTHVDPAKLNELGVKSKIRTLPEDLLDQLGMLDFRAVGYDMSMPLDQKRALVLSACFDNAHLGTPASVEKLLNFVFHEAIVEEWWEYPEGKPYRFRVRTTDPVIDPNRIAIMNRAILATKPVSRWPDPVARIRTVGNSTVYMGPAFFRLRIRRLGASSAG
jgi:hypothetical protein